MGKAQHIGDIIGELETKDETEKRLEQLFSLNNRAHVMLVYLVADERACPFCHAQYTEGQCHYDYCKYGMWVEELRQALVYVSY